AFFDAGHRHELHLFLKAHFHQFSGEEKAATLTIIRGLPLPDRGEDSERMRRGLQQQWLLPIAGQGYEPADSWLAELARAEGAMGQSPHPEFNSYHEMR